MTDFDEYIKGGNPSQKEKSYAWKTAIGLQDVDGLKPSEYLVQTAKQNIEEAPRLTLFKVQTRRFKVQILHFIILQRAKIALWRRWLFFA